MGLFERLRGARSTPDSLTAQAVARARALPGVTAVEIVEADTIALTWASATSPVNVSLADLRTRWRATSGFERIELLDDWIATLGPPDPSARTTDLEVPVTSASSPPVTSDRTPSDRSPSDWTPTERAPSGADAWPTVARRLAIVVTRSGPTGDPARWRITDDLQAHLALDRADALAVRDDELTMWGVTLAVARQAALDRLLDDGPGLAPIGRDRDAWVVTSRWYRGRRFTTPLTDRTSVR